MDSRSLLRISEVAGILNVSVARCYDMARNRILPVVRLGRQLRVDADKLEQWIGDGGQALAGGWRRTETDESAASDDSRRLASPVTE